MTKTGLNDHLNKLEIPRSNVTTYNCHGLKSIRSSEFIDAVLATTYEGRLSFQRDDYLWHPKSI